MAPKSHKRQSSGAWWWRRRSRHRYAEL